MEDNYKDQLEVIEDEEVCFDDIPQCYDTYGLYKAYMYCNEKSSE